jgi:hypothetical protein
LAILPPEAIQIIESDPLRLVILDPPNYSFGIWLLVLATGALALGIVVARNTGIGFGIIPLLVALGLAVFGSYLATSKRTYILSRQDGLLRIEKYAWGMKGKETSLPISNIRRVTVENIRFNHILTVVLKSGNSFNLGDGSNRQGYFGAADAINDFLGVARQP